MAHSAPSASADTELGHYVAQGAAQGRNGNWIQTLKGRQFWPLDPRVGDFDIQEIAAGVAKQCRFNGHTLGPGVLPEDIDDSFPGYFITVAQHCVIVSYSVPQEHALAGLMHDAPEALIGDLVRPIKYLMPAFDEIEQSILAGMAEQYGFEYPLPPCIRHSDNGALAQEARDIMAPPPEPWFLPDPPVAGKLERLWEPQEAYQRFLGRFRELTGTPRERRS